MAEPLKAKWDATWLRLVKDGNNLLKVVTPMLGGIPDQPDRDIVTRQWHVLAAAFKHDVQDGLDPTRSVGDLYELADLVADLSNYK